MAQFKKGQGGRPKGAKNKTTKEVREALSTILSENLDQLQNDIQELDPKTRVKVLLDLAKFVVPTLKPEGIEQIQFIEQPLFPPIKWSDE